MSDPTFPDPNQAFVCPHCEEEVGLDDAFCGACGADLQAEENAAVKVEARPRAARHSQARGRKRTERSKVNHELVKTLRNLKTVRTFFLLGAGLHLFWLVALWLAVPNMEHSTGTLAIGVAMNTLALVLMVSGARMVFFPSVLLDDIDGLLGHFGACDGSHDDGIRYGQYRCGWRFGAGVMEPCSGSSARAATN